MDPTTRFSTAALAAALLFATNAHAQHARIDPADLQAGATHDRFIVHYKASANVHALATARERVRRSAEAAPSTFSDIAPTVLHAMAPGAYVVRSSQPMNAVAAETWMRRLAEDPAVERVEVDARFRELYTPNDKYFAQQPYLSGGYGTAATLAWDMSQGDGVLVGVIDSGPTPHPDLDGALLPGYDFAYNDADPSTPECSGGGKSTHGTTVAGAIAALTNNGRGIAGLAPKVKVVPARTSEACGGPFATTAMSDLVRALDWLSGGPVEGVPTNRNPVEVINMSLGATKPCSESMQAAIDRAITRGTLVVVAAGNESGDVADSSPANCGNVVAVAAVDGNGKRYDFSNWGAKIDIAAPGYGIWPVADDSKVDTHYGTSLSAPMVAGVAALMQSAAVVPLPPARLEALLKASARAAPAQDKPIGNLVNAPAAVTMAQSISAPKFQGPFVFVARPLLAGEQSNNACLVVGDGGYATRPSLFRWNGVGAPETCGLPGNNAQSIWDVAPVTDSNGVTAHVIRSRVNGKCLIRGNNGNDAMASLYLWESNADKTWCGLPNADALIANGQAAWYFDAPATQLVNGKSVTTAGLKQARPNFSFLGFAPQGASPRETRHGDTKTWDFRLYPVPTLGGGLIPGVPFAAVSRLNNQCLDIEGGVYEGADLITWPCHSGNNQRFVYQDQQLLVDGKCLDVDKGQSASGVRVQAWTCHGGANQRWAIEEDGSIRSLMAGPTYCLDVHVDHGNHVRTFACNYYKGHQRFTFRAP